MSDEQQVRNHNKKYHDLNDKQYDYFEKLMGQKMSDWPEALKDAALPFRCGDELACNVADWVKEEMASNELKQLLADKEMTIGVLDAAIKAKDEVHKEDMAAAQEQLAEMRSIVEQMLRLHEAEEADELWVTCPSCNGGQTIGDRMCPTCGGVGCDLKEGIGPAWNELFAIAKQALSAAPKRGRVVAETAVDMDGLALCKPVRCEYHIGPPWPDPKGGDCGQPVEYLVEWEDGSRWYMCHEHANAVEEAL